eukprot:COSAG02_NODE_9051_length_2349_cov_1.213333_1_plen_192_part_10
MTGGGGPGAPLCCLYGGHEQAAEQAQSSQPYERMGSVSRGLRSCRRPFAAWAVALQEGKVPPSHPGSSLVYRSRPLRCSRGQQATLSTLELQLDSIGLVSKRRDVLKYREPHTHHETTTLGKLQALDLINQPTQTYNSEKLRHIHSPPGAPTGLLLGLRAGAGLALRRVPPGGVMGLWCRPRKRSGNVVRWS